MGKANRYHFTDRGCISVKAINFEGEIMDKNVVGYLDKIKLHDIDTFWHCIRTAQITELICQSISLTEQEKAIVNRAAVLHDLGKIITPTEIINKPTKLDHHEWMIVRQHPVYGAKIIEKDEVFNDIAEGILSHHERYDGSGYPYGLKGQEIPLQGRIIAIADSLDAMVTFRPYKRSKSLPQAIQELRRMSGKQFDSDIVKYHDKWDKYLLWEIAYSSYPADISKIIMA